MFTGSASVDDMYRLLQQFAIKIPTAEVVKWEDLHDIHFKFTAAMKQAQLEWANTT